MTKRVPIFFILLLAIPVHAQDKKPTTLREILLAELRSTHNNEDWFVPANIAVKGESLGRTTGISPRVLEPVESGKTQGRATRQIQRQQ